mgnify:CR=1 FL=1|jgi:hypothetical protein
MRNLTKTLCVILLSSQWAHSQEYERNDFQTDIITNPSTSLRCYELNKRRRNKVGHKHNLKSLISRNKRLLQITNEEDDKEFYLKLAKTDTRLKYELELALQKILNVEESLVRTGCPNLLQ